VDNPWTTAPGYFIHKLHTSGLPLLHRLRRPIFLFK
jgi:hypothetical protein